MKIAVSTLRAYQHYTDLLVVVGFEKENGAPVLGAAAQSVDAVLAPSHWFEEVYESGEFAGKMFDCAVLHRAAGTNAKRVALVGGGRRSAFGTTEARKLAAFAVRQFRSHATTLGFVVDGDAAMAGAVVEGAILGSWEQDHYKSTGKKSNKIETFTCVVPGGPEEELDSTVSRARIVAESQNFARDLVNDPGNVLPPRELVRRAQAMAEEVGLECDVLDRDRMKQLGMGSLLGVAVGSAEPPFLIHLRYRPATPPATTDHLALIGKGVTFDTGGISLKPADGMEKMKCDMGGAGAMLGAMRAIAQLKPAIPVSAFIPTVENMPGSRAQRPGDIVWSMSGRTIEVLNTDAEGRLILVDAITYARTQGVTHMIDAATLTGAIGVALGTTYTGLFSNNDALYERLRAAAAKEGEKMWRMPIDEEYRDQLKSGYADIANIGGRAGGACTAAMFLKDWVDDVPWAHLDIASTAYLDEQKLFTAKGATGVAVRTFIRVALDW